MTPTVIQIAKEFSIHKLHEMRWNYTTCVNLYSLYRNGVWIWIWISKLWNAFETFRKMLSSYVFHIPITTQYNFCNKPVKMHNFKASIGRVLTSHHWIPKSFFLMNSPSYYNIFIHHCKFLPIYKFMKLTWLYFGATILWEKMCFFISQNSTNSKGKNIALVCICITLCEKQYSTTKKYVNIQQFPQNAFPRFNHFTLKFSMCKLCTSHMVKHYCYESFSFNLIFHNTRIAFSFEKSCKYREKN